MDLSPIFQTRAKRFWWMDVIFYFAVSLLITAVFCYLVFMVKNGMQRDEIKKETAAMQTVGTLQQKADEQDVINYKSKIADFTKLLNGHEFASNVFAFMQSQTIPNVWFKQFGLDEKGNSVQLSGEADSMDALSRQIAVFEKNKYVKNIGTLSSSLSQAAKISFNISLSLNQNIFDYISGAVPSESPSSQQVQDVQPIQPAALNNVQNTPQPEALSSEKLVISFHIVSNPEVIGVMNETAHIISLKVPYGTDVKKLKPSIVVSPGAKVLPNSGTVQDFTNPVSYMVTAEDGSIQNYSVVVSIASAPGAAKNSQSQSKSSNSIILISGISLFVIILISMIFILRNVKPRNNILT